MSKQTTEQALRMLVESFDDEDGLPESAFVAALSLIKALVNPHAAQVFASNINATEGRFYLKEGTAARVLDEMNQDIEITGKAIHYGSTVTVDHNVQTFIVKVRSMQHVSPETIKNLIEKKFEVTEIDSISSSNYVRRVT